MFTFLAKDVSGRVSAANRSSVPAVDTNLLFATRVGHVDDAGTGNLRAQSEAESMP